MAKYEVQHIGYPVAGRAIQENEWEKLSEHKTLSAACKRINRETAHLSPGSWDDHYRVIDPGGAVMYDPMYQWAEEKKYRELIK